MFGQAELGGLGGQRVRIPRKPHANSFSTRKTLSRCYFLIKSHEVLRSPSGSVHGCASGCTLPSPVGPAPCAEEPALPCPALPAALPALPREQPLPEMSELEVATADL